MYNNKQNFTSYNNNVNSINNYPHQGASIITLIYGAIVLFVFLLLLIFDQLLLSMFRGIGIGFLMQSGLEFAKTSVAIVFLAMWIWIFSIIMTIPYNYLGKRRLVYSIASILGFIISSKVIWIFFAIIMNFEFTNDPISKFVKMSFFLPFVYLWLLSRIQKFEDENSTQTWSRSERFKTWLAHCLFMKNITNKQKIDIKEIATHGKSTAFKEGKNLLKREYSHLNAALAFGQIMALLKIASQQAFKIGEYLKPARFKTELDYGANLLFMWLMDSFIISIIAFLAYRVFAIALFILAKFINLKNTALELGLIGGISFSAIAFLIMIGGSFNNYGGVFSIFLNPLTFFIIGFVFGIIYKFSLPKPPMPIINASQ